MKPVCGMDNITYDNKVSWVVQFVSWEYVRNLEVKSNRAFNFSARWIAPKSSWNVIGHAPAGA